MALTQEMQDWLDTEAFRDSIEIPEIKITARMESHGKTYALGFVVNPENEALNAALFRSLLASVREAHRALAGAYGEEDRKRILATFSDDEAER